MGVGMRFVTFVFSALRISFVECVWFFVTVSKMFAMLALAFVTEIPACWMPP